MLLACPDAGQEICVETDPSGYGGSLKGSNRQREVIHRYGDFPHTVATDSRWGL